MSGLMSPITASFALWRSIAATKRARRHIDRRGRSVSSSLRFAGLAADADDVSETRKALLPDVVHRIYTEAKTAFDQHDPAATSQFDRLIALLDDPISRTRSFRIFAQSHRAFAT